MKPKQITRKQLAALALCECCAKRQAKVWGDLIYSRWARLCRVCLRRIVKRGQEILDAGEGKGKAKRGSR